MAYMLDDDKDEAALRIKKVLEKDEAEGRRMLNELLDIIMEPSHQSYLKRREDLAGWVKALLSAGTTFEKLCQAISVYDKSPFCGCVWTANFVAYRCKTCATSPCMSICAACFERGNHEGHEYNIFRSEAGGACDCGDKNVMSEKGFCSRHGVNRVVPDNMPESLLFMPKMVMERIILLLLHICRYLVKNSVLESSFPSKIPDPVMETYELFIELMKQGSPIRSWVSDILLSEEYYERLNTKQYYAGVVTPEMRKYHEDCYNWFPEAAKRLPLCEAPEEIKNPEQFGRKAFVYKNLLQEFAFWTVRFEFPETLILFLLNMLPDEKFKEAFARAFVQHYIYIAPSLFGALHVEQLANRIVHISVQLFSNSDLAAELARNNGLLEIFVISLNFMVTHKLTQSQTSESDFHQCVKTRGQGIRNNAYWAIVSDLVNCLGHNEVAKLFLNNEPVMKIWMRILLCFSGMNLTSREMEKHVEYDPQNILLAFYTEREACAAPLWVLIDVLRDASTLPMAMKFIEQCFETAIELLDALGVDDEKATGIPFNLISFHYPIHRYFGLFVANAVSRQGLKMGDLQFLNQTFARRMMGHPLQVLCTSHEIMCNMWVRNGINISTQNLAYKQSFFCTFCIDADLLLLQLCSCYMSPDIFISSVFDRFRVSNCLTVENEVKVLPPDAHGADGQPDLDRLPKMLEAAFATLVSVLSIKTQLGISDQTIVENELVAVLSTQSWTHSALSEHIPQCHDMHAGEKSRRFTKPLTDAIEKLTVTDEGDAMAQTQYSLRDEFWPMYNPIFTAHRAMYKKNVQQSHTNYFKYLQRTNKLDLSALESTVWPPYQPIRITDDRYVVLNRILNCRTLHTAIFMILYKYMQSHSVISEQTLVLAIHLLEAALFASPQERGSTGEEGTSAAFEQEGDRDSDWKRMLDMWFMTNNMSTNIRQVIDSVQVSPGSPQEEIFHDAMETDEQLKNIRDSGTSAGEPERCVVIQESIITLLIKLHEKLTGRRNSFVFPAEFVPDLDPASPVPPTGPSVIAKILLFAASKSPENEKVIVDICGTAPPVDGSTARSSRGQLDSERERRKKKAQEMQKRLLKEFASKQKEFLEKAEIDMPLTEESTEEGMAVDDNSNEEERVDCVICGGSGEKSVSVTGSNESERANSARSQIIGLVCFVQTSGLLGFRTGTDEKRPLITPGSNALEKETCKSLNLKICEDLESKFPHEFNSFTLGNHIDWQSAPHISTCGHYLHIGCYQDYMKWVERDETGYIRFESGLGFQCPLCRQTSNAVVPCNIVEARPAWTEQKTELFKTYTPDTSLSEAEEKYQKSLTELHNVIRANEPVRTVTVPDEPEEENDDDDDNGSSTDPIPTKEVDVLTVDEVLKACHHTAEEIMKENQTRLEKDVTDRMDLRGVLRGQLEYDLHQFGGHLAATKAHNSSSKLNRKVPVAALFHVLCKTIRGTSDTTNNEFANKLWTHLTGVLTKLKDNQKDCPLLFKDPIALLLELCIATYPFSLGEYQTIVHLLYNLTLVQALVQISCKFSPEERRAWKSSVSVSVGGVPFSPERLDSMLGQVISSLPRSLFDDSATAKLLSPGSPGLGTQGFTSTVWSPQCVQSSVEELLLHYLRLTALLQFHVFDNINLGASFTISPSADKEFLHLAKYLGLIDDIPTEVPDSPSVLVAKWPTSPRSIINQWCKEAEAVIHSNREVSLRLLTRHRAWKQPALVDLPPDYTQLFTKFRDIKCPNCKFTSRQPAICLLCGKFVCYKGMCQHSRDVYNEKDKTRHRVGPKGAAVHARMCGNGTVVYLDINATTINIVRGPRSCVWGTLYLDQHGEEDRGWKRGRELMLKQERLNLLNFQWLNHIFDNACKNWSKHRNQL